MDAGIQCRRELRAPTCQKVSFVQTPNPKVLLKSIWSLSCFNGKSMLAKMRFHIAITHAVLANQKCDMASLLSSSDGRVTLN